MTFTKKVAARLAEFALVPSRSQREFRMKRTTSWSDKWALGIAGAALVVFAMAPAAKAQGPGGRISIVSDWSQRHVVFSRPNSLERAWRLQAEPRYRAQVLGRNARRLGRVNESEDKRNDSDEFGRGHKESKKAFQRDWGQSLGANGSTGVPRPVRPGFLCFPRNIHSTSMPLQTAAMITWFSLRICLV